MVAGTFVARYCLRQGIWQHLRPYLLLLVSLWFICSGSLELFVSGMEVLQRLGIRLTTTIFNLWRGRADNVLVGVSLVLFFCLLAYPLLRKLGARRS